MLLSKRPISFVLVSVAGTCGVFGEMEGLVQQVSNAYFLRYLCLFISEEKEAIFRLVGKAVTPLSVAFQTQHMGAD